MLAAFAYLVHRIIRNIILFLRHWYVDSFLSAGHFLLGIFESLDRSFAVRINARNIFQPLYQDRSFLGHILGFILRSVRVTAGSILYTLIFLVAVCLYLLWLFVPVFVLLNIFNAPWLIT